MPRSPFEPILANRTPKDLLMRLLTKSLLAAAILVAAPLGANAESNTVTSGNATARLDVKVVIPRMLLLQVGSSGSTVDMVTFDMTSTPGNIGDGTAVAGTGGDLTGGVVTAKVVGNNGNVTLVADATGALSNGTETIPYSEISTTAATNTTGTVLSAPTLTNGTSAAVVLSATNKVVKQDAKWTFKYKNTNVVAAGTYGGSVANNGRVTYTASMP